MLPEFSFTNGSPRRLLLVIEPKSLEYWVDSKATVKIVAEHAYPGRTVDFEITANGLIAYAPTESRIRVLMNGKEVRGHPPTRTMARKLG